MKIERRITPNRRDKQASEELRNNSPVKLATFPSFYLFLFLFFLRSLLFADAYHLHSSLPSFTVETVLFFFPILFFSFPSFPRTPVSLLPYFALFGREQRQAAAGRCSFFLQTSTERAQAREFACHLPAHARSETHRPEMLTLCRPRRGSSWALASDDYRMRVLWDMCGSSATCFLHLRIVRSFRNHLAFFGSSSIGKRIRVWSTISDRFDSITKISKRISRECHVYKQDQCQERFVKKKKPRYQVSYLATLHVAVQWINSLWVHRNNERCVVKAV